ncbi:TetR/AcrR family transcriptional regulator [Phenylobacterium ferrooxidans]|uniref:TetR/AcrR family transcriptional regulator n=1 Tax=Phenylobacterium ferrooxidans TaxID=2982689 RepID=A0ABW6CT34_9CAUL
MATDPKSRDRAKTETAIVAAAREVLARDGFQGFGINAVARAAGCDKQLIYRYFGGLEGLVDALGADFATWLEDSLGPATPAASYGELSERLILGFMDALRGNVLVQRITAWEIADPSPLVARLTAARGAAMVAWMARTRGDLASPAGLDAPALNIFLIAGVQQLVLSSSAVGSFSGVPLASEADWDRVRAAAVRIIRAVYGE